MSGAQPKAKHSGYERDGLDFYVEPVWATELLLDVEEFDGPIWDPACGQGNIVEACRVRSLPIFGSDIVDRGCPGARLFDFLTGFNAFNADPPPHIITNPPYGKAKLAIRFIDRALEVTTGKVAVLVNESFLFAKGRHDLFAEWPLRRIWFLSSRPSMPPGEKLATGEIKAKGGQTNYVWLVFDHSHRGPPTCGWLRK